MRLGWPVGLGRALEMVPRGTQNASYEPSDIANGITEIETLQPFEDFSRQARHARNVDVTRGFCRAIGRMTTKRAGEPLTPCLKED